MTNTSIARASDDFYPRDAASSHPHLAACAFNGLFMSVLVQPDWDMFHSKHTSARLHAMARQESDQWGHFFLLPLASPPALTARQGKHGCS